MKLLDGLMQYKKEYLLEFARIYDVQSAYKMKKKELAQALAEKMCEHLLIGLSYLSPDDYQVFVKLKGRRKVKFNHKDIESYRAIENLGLMSMGESGQVEVCEEIINAFNKQIKNPAQKKWLLEKQAFRQKVRNYMSAATNLYGMLPGRDFLNLYAAYEGIEDPVSAELMDVMHVMYGEDIYHFSFDEEGWLMDESLELASEEEMTFFKQQVGCKAYYIPGKEEFLRYVDSFYYEESKEVKHLKDFLFRRFPAEHELLDDMIFELIDHIKTGILPQTQVIHYFLTDLDQKGFHFKDMNEINELVKWIMLVNNHTRMWINRGFTPAEIRSSIEAGRHKKKIGRNDPCPCGSGKKYKNCCGNK